MFYFLHLKNNDLLTFSGLIKAYRLSFIKFDLTYHKYNNDHILIFFIIICHRIFVNLDLRKLQNLIATDFLIYFNL